MEYCTNCGSSVAGEPLIPDRGMRLCWPCAESVLEAATDCGRLGFMEDYASGHLDPVSIGRARLEAEALGARKAA